MIATIASAATIGQPPTGERIGVGAAVDSGPRRRTWTTSLPSGGGFALECVGSALPGDPPGAAQREAVPGQRGDDGVSKREQQTEYRRNTEMPSGSDLDAEHRGRAQK